MKTGIRKGLLAVVLLAPLAAGAHDAVLDRRGIAVSGEGEVTTLPDRARLSLAVEELAPEVKAAEAAVNKVTRAVLAEVKALGTKDEHVSTAGMSINPEYVWDEKTRNNRLTGYRARRDIQILITDLDKLGDYVLRATKAGVNQVSPPQLESSRAKEFEREAMVMATKDARSRAQALADTLGVRLGPIRTLDASGQQHMPPPMPMPMRAMKAEAAYDSGNQEMGFAAGEIRFSATVRADFDVSAP